MSIDPKRIEEWRALVPMMRELEEGLARLIDSGLKDKSQITDLFNRPGVFDAFILLAGEAAPALLSEREEMLAVLRDVWTLVYEPGNEYEPMPEGEHVKARLAALLRGSP